MVLSDKHMPRGHMTLSDSQLAAPTLSLFQHLGTR